MQHRLKVLIADDEPNIREGIRDSIEWEQVDLEVVAEAEDGEEALELALAHQIDVLLVDLNMPIMNGLTCVKELRKNLPDCKVVIISGYDEFRYAQEALRLKVDDYLLKPVKPENLVEVLKNVVGKIKAEAEEAVFMQMASSHITQNTFAIQERFGMDWVEGHMMEEKIIDELRFLKLPTRPPEQLAVIRSQEFKLDQPFNNGQERELFIFAIKNIVLEILGKETTLIFTDQKAGLLFIIHWGDIQEEKYLQVEKAIHEYLSILVTLHVEINKESSFELKNVYRTCKEKVLAQSRISPIVKRAKTIIKENYCNHDLTLESIAQKLQISPVHLSRTIKQELGTSFVTYLTSLRIKKAIKLLNTTDLQMYEIAEQVGYESQHYFSTAFKKSVGVSPNQYRKGIAK